MNDVAVSFGLDTKLQYIYTHIMNQNFVASDGLTNGWVNQFVCLFIYCLCRFGAEGDFGGLGYCVLLSCTWTVLSVCYQEGGGVRSETPDAR